MRTPDEAMHESRAAVLLAVVRLHGMNGRVTVKDICLATGLRSTSTVHAHLRSLQAEGLVEWEPGTRGTLRPAVTRVPV